MERAVGRLGLEYAARDQQTLFDQLRPFLTSDTQSATRSASEPAAPPELADAAVRTAVYRLRKRYGRVLRAEIEDTVGAASDVDDELRHLLRIMSA
jgi:RNA polymerase sigma-70 factor (ECF subfamily)